MIKTNQITNQNTEIIVSEKEFPIKSVLLSENNAIVTREGNIKIELGRNSIIISNLAIKLNKTSIHVVLVNPSKNITLQNPMIRTIELKQESTSEEIDIQKDMKNIDNKLNKLRLNLNDSRENRNNEINLITKTTDEFPKTYSEDIIQLNELKKIINFTKANLDNIYINNNEIQREIQKLEYEQLKLKSKLREINSEAKKSYNNLEFSVLSDEIMNSTIQIRYWVPAIWNPSYDLKINKNTAKMQYWGIIENLSGEDWIDVQLKLAYTSFSDHPIKRPDEMTLEMGVEGKLDELFQKYRNTVEKKQTTEILSPKIQQINVNADGETHAYLLHEFSSEAELFYYWNAAETDYIVIGIELNNGEIDLLPGECNFFKDGNIIGRGRFNNLLESNQLIRLPLAIETTVVATKRLIKQKKVKGKKFLLTYKLHLQSKKDTKKIKILDVMPLSNHPRSKINLIDGKPAPMKEKGILKWNIELKDKWEAEYTIEIQGIEKIQ